MSGATPVTMKHIAAQAGVDRSTVSLALRNHPSLPAKTNARIQHIARQMGYRPNPLVAALMMHRAKPLGVEPTATIAYVTELPADQSGLRLRNPVQRAMRQGLALRASALGFRIEEFHVGQAGMSSARISDILIARGICGIVLGPRTGEKHEPLHIDWDRFACVSLGSKYLEEKIDYVCTDHYQNMRLISERCRQLGYRRIGLVLRKELSELLEHRFHSACLLDQTDQPMGERCAPLIEPHNLPWPERTVEWCRAERPDVIVSTISELGQEWLKLAAGLPGRPAVVSVSVEEQNGVIAGIFQDGAQLGAMALELVAARVQHNEIGVRPVRRSYLLDGVWVEGISCPPKKPKARHKNP
ncbi:MAG: LacI family DNA-binding transcriptional regulator [Nitrospira sp.]|nr:LacI family DNA-binding transcriptional regulator [Nitrospira sp.]